jgi:hypothetical protein
MAQVFASCADAANKTLRAMQYRLISLLTDIEKAIRCSLPDADGTTLESSRMVSFHTGLARLSFRARGPNGTEPRGQLQLQHFNLADGRVSVKVHLSWAGSDAHRFVELYTLPGQEWSTEVQRVAEAWLDGPPVGVGSENTLLAAAS